MAMNLSLDLALDPTLTHTLIALGLMMKTSNHLNALVKSIKGLIKK
jgi:hypothetical protein